MFSKFLATLLGLLMLFIATAGSGQTPTPGSSQPPGPGLPKLTGNDDKRAKQLDEQIDKAMKADHWDEGIARAEELWALRTRLQGATHFETVDAAWQVKTLRRVAALPRDDRAVFLSTSELNKQAELFLKQGRFSSAQPLDEKALEIRRRLLTGNHPDTANSYNDVAYDLNARGKYGEAQPLYEKALEIRRRLLTDNHPTTATSYNNVAGNLDAQGKYGAARPLHEKALEIRRRLLTDDHPRTTSSFNNLALNLLGQGKYAEAQPLFEKALEIKRRILGDDHPDTARSYNNLAGNLDKQGKYAAAQPLFEKAMMINRHLLGDDHFQIALSFNNLAFNLMNQGKYTAAQPLFEKALEIRRRTLTDDHPLTATGYNNLAGNLEKQGKYTAAQPLLEQALEIFRRHLTDDHPDTATSYNNVAYNLDAQGKYAAAQPLHEKALEIKRRLLTDDHPITAVSYNYLAVNLYSAGKCAEARDQWIRAARSFEAARLTTAFTGLDRATATGNPLLFLAVVLARLGQPTEAWQRLEENLGRGLLDELDARQDHRLPPQERTELQQRIAELERLDRLFEAPMEKLDQAERRKRFEDLRQQRDRAQIALGELRSQLAQKYGPLAGKVAPLSEIQSALPGDAALVAWIDLKPFGPNAADPSGEHWGVVIRAQGAPVWVRLLAGTGKDRQWTEEDTRLTGLVRDAFRQRPGPGAADTEPLIQRLRAQRLSPLTAALKTTADRLPPVRRLIVLPSAAMTGVPVEALLSPGDPWTVSYAPSATVLTYLRKQPKIDTRGGLLALGDPVFAPSERSAEPGPLPDHGLLLTVVVPGANAAQHGLKPGDVLLAYNGAALRKREDLKAVPEPGQPVPVEVWRDGQVARRELSPGQLGVVFDPRPAAVALQDQRRLNQVLTAARSGSEHFQRLPGTRYEVQALAHLFETAHQPARLLIDTEASEPGLDQMAASGALGRFTFIHLATHGLIDETIPQRSAVILTQTDLPDPLTQVLNHKPAYDGRLAMREIQRGWDLKAELVTLSACETARGQYAGGEGFVGFTQALLLSGARSVCLSLWNVDDTATALLMQRFYANLLGARSGLSQPMPKAEALAEAASWLRGLRREEVAKRAAVLSGGEARSKGATKRNEVAPALKVPTGPGDDRPYAHPYYWAAFVLVGDPD